VLTATVLAANANQSAAALFIDLIATVIMFVALIRIIATPRQKWAHGLLSKTAWIVATIWFTPYLGWLVLPVGALVAIWKTHDLQHGPGDDSLEVPFAEGEPATDQENVQ
jgi:hypothetical protein